MNITMRYAEQNNKLPDRYEYLNSDLPPEVRLIRQHQAIAQKRKMKNDIEKQLEKQLEKELEKQIDKSLDSVLKKFK